MEHALIRFLWVKCGRVALVDIFFWYSDEAAGTIATYPLLGSLQTYRSAIVAANLSDNEPAPSASPHITA
jgi:hypothetical protein